MQISHAESNIVSLRTTLATATNSAIVTRATAEIVEPKGLVTYMAGSLVVGLVVGCFAVFFLELYAKAKIRAAETA